MIQCDGCGRHVRAADESCPFCDAAPRSALASKILLAAGAILTPVVLAACYGTGPFEETGDDTDPVTDTDTDN